MMGKRLCILCLKNPVFRTFKNQIICKPPSELCDHCNVKAGRNIRGNLIQSTHQTHQLQPPKKKVK